ncbi:MAG: PTS sugar transporter subunit IIB, partial [Deltaproteobacteria bacterium]|nr:PTS sugar transporter subunit IIB [Deltaproteobacteria bacterium]
IPVDNENRACAVIEKDSETSSGDWLLLNLNMDETFVRIDNRLVHGQILEGWVPFLGVSRIVVVDDEVAGDIFRETVIKMAVPYDIEVIVFSVDEFACDYHYGDNDGKRAIILFQNIADAHRAYRLGFRFGELNIGNIHFESDRVCCSSSIYLNRKDIADLEFLAGEGVHIELRSVPRDRPVEFISVMKKIDS